MAELKQRKGVERSNQHKDNQNTPPSSSLSSSPSPSPSITTRQGQAEDRWKKWWTRTWSSLFLIVSFLLVLYAGPFALVLLCFILQSMVYKEMLDITYRRINPKLPNVEKPFVLFPYLNWWWFITLCFFLYGRAILRRFPSVFLSSPTLSLFALYHNFICFAMYVAGFITFVATLRRGFYKYQFKQLAYTHMTLLIAIALSSPFVNNIFDGMIWFLLPALIIICNDTWAYIWGFFFGRRVINTPLISLSPKKTWEGFIGAFFSTLIFGFVASYYLSFFSLLICPKEKFWETPRSCPTPYNFQFKPYALPDVLVTLLSSFGVEWTSVTLMPIQLHALVFATFGSLIAPFGGFFASGLKRSMNIKDFGDSIPGHGGVADRMDCQVLMSLFAYIYLNTFVKGGTVEPSHVLDTIYSMPQSDQMWIYEQLHEHLFPQ